MYKYLILTHIFEKSPLYYCGLVFSKINGIKSYRFECVNEIWYLNKKDKLIQISSIKFKEFLKKTYNDIRLSLFPENFVSMVQHSIEDPELFHDDDLKYRLFNKMRLKLYYEFKKIKTRNKLTISYEFDDGRVVSIDKKLYFKGENGNLILITNKETIEKYLNEITNYNRSIDLVFNDNIGVFLMKDEIDEILSIHERIKNEKKTY